MGGHFKFNKRKQDTVTLRQCIEALEKAANELWNHERQNYIPYGMKIEEYTHMKIAEWMGEKEYSNPRDLERKETVK